MLDTPVQGVTRASQDRRLVLRALLVAVASVGPAMAVAQTATATAADAVSVSIDASKPGAKIDRNIFGQFAEHLGTGV